MKYTGKFESEAEEQAFFRALGKEIAWALSASCSDITMTNGTLDISGSDWGFGYHLRYTLGNNFIHHDSEASTTMRKISAKTYIKRCAHDWGLGWFDVEMKQMEEATHSTLLSFLVEECSAEVGGEYINSTDTIHIPHPVVTTKERIKKFVSRYVKLYLPLGKV